MFNPYKKTYKMLGIDLPRSFEGFGLASRYLDRVNREPCDNVAFTALARLMESAGYPRESAKSLEAYNRSCTFSEEMLRSAYSAYIRIGDHKAAINVADELVKFDPASYDYRFMRGSAYENAGDYKAALVDYISTLDLFPDLSNVAGSQFYQVSTMYDKLGRPCDAIGPLETFISYNVKERQSQQIAKLISDYARRPRWRNPNSMVARLQTAGFYVCDDPVERQTAIFVEVGLVHAGTPERMFRTSFFAKSTSFSAQNSPGMLSAAAMAHRPIWFSSGGVAAMVHTNTIEGYFSILKRGINGVYHHVSQQHLKVCASSVWWILKPPHP
jgi:tetratricopeptide (TPR) repeat protein